MPPRWSGDKISSKTCQKCQKTFKKRHDLLVHIAKIHKKSRNFPCDQCDYKASIPFLLLKHKRRIHEKNLSKDHLCTECGKSFKEKTLLQQHVKFVHQNDENLEEILCFTCGQILKSKISMKKHLVEIHNKNSNRTPSQNPETPFKCGSCDNSEFSQVDQLRAHLRDCHKSERQLTAQNAVKTAQTAVKKYSCQDCGKIYSNKISLEHHVNKIHDMIKR